MDLVSASIIAALNAGIGEPVKDAYSALKKALNKKFGDNSEVIDAVKNLEKRPDSSGRQTTLQEEIETIKAQEDPQIKQSAEMLMKKLEEISEGQKAAGNHKQVEQRTEGDQSPAINTNEGNVTINYSGTK